MNFSANGTSAMHCKVQEEIKEVEISLKEYTQLCQPLLAKIRKPVQRSLSDARLKLSDIDEIVLVGGATRLCIVRDFIIKMFHKFPDISMNPDEAVALGAAIQGAIEERNQAVKEVILQECLCLYLGTDVMIIREDGSQESGHFYPIIERNTVIPASRTERFYTCRDNQDIVTVQVLQGESRYAANNLLLGEISVEVPKKKAGEEESIDVTYTYDINSILEVEVQVNSTKENAENFEKPGKII